MRVVACLGCLAFPQIGCEELDGGAVELSWTFFTTRGEPLECAAANVGAVRVVWEVQRADGTSTSDFETFECEDESGATSFRITPGRAAFSVLPICESGEAAAPGTFESPPPIVRTVDDGRVVTLDTLLVVLRRDGCTAKAPCACP